MFISCIRTGVATLAIVYSCSVIYGGFRIYGSIRVYSDSTRICTRANAIRGRRQVAGMGMQSTWPAYIELAREYGDSDTAAAADDEGDDEGEIYLICS